MFQCLIFGAPSCISSLFGRKRLYGYDNSPMAALAKMFFCKDYGLFLCNKNVTFLVQSMKRTVS